MHPQPPPDLHIGVSRSGIHRAWARSRPSNAGGRPRRSTNHADPSRRARPRSIDTLDGVFVANEAGVVGAINVLNQAGKTGKIKIIGWDTSPDEVKGVTSGAITTLVVQNPFRMGFDSVNAMVKTVRKESG
jgi:DNA-binding LacI/PurR family transcriptional regulator